MCEYAIQAIADGTTTSRQDKAPQWADGREAGLQSEADAVTLTVTSRTMRSVHGEYEFDAAGPLTDRAGSNPRDVTATVRGTFEAMDFTPMPGGYRQ